MAVLGYGLGGYGGHDEPWGSVEFPLLSSLGRDAASTDWMGIIETVSGIIGEADAEINGFRSTRITSLGTKGDIEINVESTLDWESSGKIGIEGIVYYYTYITPTTIGGLTFIYSTTSQSGLAKNHNENSEVIDLNRNFSALDKLRRALLVDYAEAEDLDIIGRDLGVPRIPLFGDDDTYREVIKAVAYCPRGTVYGLELALDAILGAGTYEIYEDLIMRPNEVFIKLGDDLLADSPIGKTYLTNNTYGLVSGSQDTIVLDHTPLKVIWAKLKDLSEHFDFRDNKPSDLTYEYYEGASPASAFTYNGSISESSAVTVSSGLYTEISVPSSGNAYYDMLDTQGARIEDYSQVIFDTTICIPSTATLISGDLDQICFTISDGSHHINLGVDSGYEIGLWGTIVGGFLGNTYTLNPDEFYNIRVEKDKDEYVDFYVNGQLINHQGYAYFGDPTTDHLFTFGCLGAPATGVEFYIKHLGLNIINKQDIWSYYDTGVGSVSSTTPNKFTVSGGYTFTSSDVGKCLRVQDSAITNPYGGNNNILSRIYSVNSSTEVTLQCVGSDGAVITEGTPARIEFPECCYKLKYPDDLGRKVQITGSSLGNNGTYTITALLEENTLNDFADYDTPLEEYTSICEVNSSTLTSEVDLGFEYVVEFQTEAGLSFTQSDAGSRSGDTLTLREALWFNNLLIEVGVTDVLSAQILRNIYDRNSLISTSPNLYEYYPFYLSDTMEGLYNFLIDLTVAGVIPRIDVG